MTSRVTGVTVATKGAANVGRNIGAGLREYLGNQRLQIRARLVQQALNLL